MRWARDFVVDELSAPSVASTLSRVIVLVEGIEVPLTTIRFSFDDSPFSTVEAVEVSEKGYPGQYYLLPWSEELVFQIIRRRRDGHVESTARRPRHAG
jgi:hypothetical protein